MLKCGEVLIVSGPPGSGKTTVSAALAAGGLEICLDSQTGVIR